MKHEAAPSKDQSSKKMPPVMTDKGRKFDKDGKQGSPMEPNKSVASPLKAGAAGDGKACSSHDNKVQSECGQDGASKKAVPHPVKLNQ